MANALIVGCANNVWQDVKAAQELTKFDRVYCVKLAGVHWPEDDFTWVTLHPEFMDKYEAERASLGFPKGYEIVAPMSNEVGQHGKKGNINRRITYRYQGMNSSASSGIYAAKIALEDGHSKVILAGVPLDGKLGHFTRGKPWHQRDSFIGGFNLSVPHMKGKVKSMSGHTREILGFPDQQWLESKPAG